MHMSLQCIILNLFSNFFLTVKRDRTIWISHDYGLLNPEPNRYVYPIQGSNECIHCLADCMMFSKLMASRGTGKWNVGMRIGIKLHFCHIIDCLDLFERYLALKRSYHVCAPGRS